MRALSTSIVLVVTVLVVLVTALVVIMIFSGGINQVNTITNFRNNCITQCRITCAMGALPPTWDAEVNVQGYSTPQSCGSITLIHNTCSGVCGEASTTGATCTGTPPTCVGSAGCKVCGTTCGFC